MDGATTDARFGHLLEHFPALPASHLLRTDRFDRQQDLSLDWMSPERCWLLLFASHRWEDRRHPDPHRHQHRALRSLIVQMCDLTEALSAPTLADRLRIIPDLGRDGVVQAAVLLSRLDLGHAEEAAEPGWARRTLPGHIGIWYDYACLLQAPRSARDEERFRAALVDLDRLFGADGVTLVALRQAGDDYRSRAWCRAEALLAANRIVDQGVVVRIDRMGKPLPPAPENRERNSELTARLAAALAGWRTTADPAVAADCLQFVAFLAGHSPLEWFLGSDGISPVYLGDVVAETAVWLGSILTTIGRSEDRSVDLAAVLRELAVRAGVRCSVYNDLVLVMLLMLAGTAAPDSAIGTFYRRCRQRHVAGLPLRVRRTDDRGEGLVYQLLELDPD